MFTRSIDWSEHRNNILFFATMLGGRPWEMSDEARDFLVGVQSGYRRVGLAGAPDAWKALGAACIWLACCYPEKLQLVMAGTSTSGQAWVRFLKRICAESNSVIREHLLFSRDDTMILVRNNDEPVLSIVSPAHLSGLSKIENGRPVVLLLPDLDRVLTQWMPALGSFVRGPEDQWLTVLPVR